MKKDDLVLKTATQLTRMKTSSSNPRSKAIPNKFEAYGIGRIFCWIAFICVGLFLTASIGSTWPSRSISFAVASMLIVSCCWRKNKVFVLVLWAMLLSGVALRYWGA